MSDIHLSSLHKALDSNNIDMPALTNFKDDLDKINKSRSTQSVLLASLCAKLADPDWDTRFHEVQNGGKRSLRGISGKVNRQLHLMSLIPKPTDYACLSPALKGDTAAFDEHFTGSIQPRESLVALLPILKVINTTATPELLTTMLQYILSTLKDKKKREDAMKESNVVSSRGFSLINIINMLNELYALGNGSSKLPVIAVFTMISSIQPYVWPTLSVVALKEHTEADKDRSCGDVEAVDSSNKLMMVVEIKHKQPITDSVIKTVNDKITGKDIPLTFILSTKTNTVKQFVKNNISIDTVNGFVTTYLHMALLHEKNICSIFLQELRKQIVNYGNLNLEIKEKANAILTSLLVSPSL